MSKNARTAGQTPKRSTSGLELLGFRRGNRGTHGVLSICMAEASSPSYIQIRGDSPEDSSNRNSFQACW